MRDLRRDERRRERRAKRRAQAEDANIYRGTITGITKDRTLEVSINCGFDVHLSGIETKLTGAPSGVDLGPFTGIVGEPVLLEVKREARVWRSTIYIEKSGGWMNLNRRLRGETEYADPSIFERLYWYELTAERIYDGDTITSGHVEMLGPIPLRLENQRFRLWGINAPEMRGHSKLAGKASREALISMITGVPLVAQIDGDETGKYGRWLTVVWAKHDDEWIDVNQWMVDNGHAAEYMR